MHYIIFLLALLFVNIAEAIDCKTPPDCESLGYSKDNDPNCTDDGYMFCPFDFNFKKCVEKDCAKLGFTESDKTSWCDEIVTCKDNEKFTACACAAPQPEPCVVGSVYYANGTCSSVENYQGCGTPVGVVYWVGDAEGKHGKVINLHDLGKASSSASFDPANPYQTNRKIFSWGSYGTDISDLTNWECNGSDNNYLTVAKKGDHEDAFWSAGKEYTQIIAKAQSSNLQYAAPATLAFYPPEVSENDPKVGKGKWYLPTLGELMDLYGYDYNNVANDVNTCETSTGATGKTKTTVNATLRTLKDKSAGNAETLTDSFYWSSSEFNSYHSWMLDLSSGNRYYNTKYNYDYVRASLQF